MEWLKYVDNLKAEHPLNRLEDSGELLPQYVLTQLAEATRGESIVVTGVGQHQMWAAQYCTFQEPNTLITSGGSGFDGV